MSALQRVALIVLGLVLLAAKRSEPTRTESIVTTLFQMIGVALIVYGILG